MNQFLEIVRGTPIWVWALFGYLLFRGVRALKPREVSVKNLYMLPMIFMTLGIYRLAKRIQAPYDILIWAAALFFGILFGWLLVSRISIKSDKQKKIISLPGGPGLLVMVLIFFSIKYFFGYRYKTTPDAESLLWLHICNFLASGLITGIVLGRILCLWRRYQKE